jgi:hypothetical protein
MAGTGGDKLPAAKCNQVQQEQIWKDYVHHEDVAAKRWLTTWGFLCDEYSKVSKFNNPSMHIACHVSTDDQ